MHRGGGINPGSYVELWWHPGNDTKVCVCLEVGENEGDLHVCCVFCGCAARGSAGLSLSTNLQTVVISPCRSITTTQLTVPGRWEAASSVSRRS